MVLLPRYGCEGAALPHQLPRSVRSSFYCPSSSHPLSMHPSICIPHIQPHPLPHPCPHPFNTCAPTHIPALHPEWLKEGPQFVAPRAVPIEGHLDKVGHLEGSGVSCIVLLATAVTAEAGAVGAAVHAPTSHRSGGLSLHNQLSWQARGSGVTIKSCQGLGLSVPRRFA
jgi:hypothetical protein